MARKPETVFRAGKVIPFLKTLKNTASFPIQQISIRGTTDFILCCHGIFVGLELKDDLGSLSSLQEYNLKQIEKCGGIAMVAYPKNWDEIKMRLKRLDEGESG